ncbi:hypothetical protein JCM15764A_10080 [Geotalea toluenoxydans]
MEGSWSGLEDLKILDGIPRPLARELFAQVKEGEEIPEALYAAVGEILAYVYKLKGKV